MIKGIMSKIKSKAAIKSEIYPEGQVWLMDPAYVSSSVAELIECIDLASGEVLSAALHQRLSEEANKPIELTPDENGVATINIQGQIHKNEPWLMKLFGVPAASIQTIRSQLNIAAKNPDIKGVLLNIDSPGGVANGIPELADHIGDLRAYGKPVVASASGTMASAAYYLGSQADKIYASKSTSVGSIGAYAVHHDSHRAMEAAGVDTMVIRSAGKKGRGLSGGDEDKVIARSQIQESVNKTHQMFENAVKAKRNIEDPEVFSGSSWVAEDAKSKNLIDEIGSSEDAYNYLTTIIPKPETKADPLAGVLTGQASQPSEANRAVLTEESMEEITMDEKTKAEVEALRAELEQSKKALEAVKAAAENEKKLALIEGAVAAGKIVPANKMTLVEAAAGMSCEALEKVISGLSVVAHVGVSGVVGKEPADAPKELTEEEMKIARVFGLSIEELRKAE